jgi:hypothetical protein
MLQCTILVVGGFMTYANVEFKTYAQVLVAGEYTEMPIVVCGVVDVDKHGCSNPEIVSVWNAITDEEISMTRVWKPNLVTARQELLGAFSTKIDFDYETYCLEQAKHTWTAWRFKAQ